jgi:glycosyltransferase involved in cell wall biosynthesis
MMNILHTEASKGWGGQERRILQEAEGMRTKGHTLYFLTQTGAELAKQAREKGFEVWETDFQKRSWILTLPKLLFLMLSKNIQYINTHSSLDSWIGAIAGRMAGVKVLRTRHISNPIRKGWNSHILYRLLPHGVVTTCEEMSACIKQATGLQNVKSIPTGLSPEKVREDLDSARFFREKYGISDQDFLVGTVCILRGWKGVAHLLEAAKILKEHSYIKWVIVGDGPSREYFNSLWKEWGLENQVIFTGYLPRPYDALSAMDLFTLLSYQHEGVSQASLQAAWLNKPLITTPTGGLKEVCIPEKTGFLVAPASPQEVADQVLKLSKLPDLRAQMGRNAHALVEEKFLFPQMVEKMEKTFQVL